MREGLRKVSRLARVRKCGCVALGQYVAVKGPGGDGHAGYGGLSTCGSVWACPVCAAKIAVHRRGEVAALIRRAEAEGLHVSMLTLTQRHHAGQRLDALWEALAYAWGRVTSGRRWVDFREQLGVVGYVKATEVTHGKAGWHVHLHVLVLSVRDPRSTPVFYQRKQGRRRTPYPVEVTTPAAFIADRWGTALAVKGVDVIADRGGLDWQTARQGDAQTVGRYVAKITGAGSLANEATLGGFKRARRGNRTPFQILGDLLETGDADDLDLWRTWEKASKGRRALVWSHGLRAWAGLGVELTDEEVAEQTPEGETVALLEGPAWKAVRAAGPLALLAALEAGGAGAGYAWLDRHGIPYVVPRSPGNG